MSIFRRKPKPVDIVLDVELDVVGAKLMGVSILLKEGRTIRGPAVIIRCAGMDSYNGHMHVRFDDYDGLISSNPMVQLKDTD